MNILHLIPSLKKGGAERLVLNICNELQLHPQIKVKLITFSNNNDYEYLSANIDWKVINAYVKPSIKGKTEIFVRDLQLAIDEFKPDVIHSHLFETEMILSFINYPQAKYFVHFHDNMQQFENLNCRTFFNKKKLTNLYEKQLVLRAYRKRKTHCIAISKHGFAYLERVLPYQVKKILLPNAIDTGRFKKIETKTKDLLIITTGSLFNIKGHDLAIEVVEELHRRGQPITLYILGDGPNRFKLEELIAQKNLTQYIKLLGNVENPEKYLNNAILYLHTATYEQFGLAIIEAMACGLPVVSTDGKGNKDLLIQGKNGFMIKERNPSLLADKIEFLIRNPEVRLKMGNFAQKFSEKFDIKSYVNRLIEIYEN